MRTPRKAGKRKRVSRKGFSARKRLYTDMRSTAMVAPRPFPLYSKNHNFKQKAVPSSSSFVVTGGSYSTTDGLLKGAVAGGADTTFTFTPRVDDLPQSATFSSLFDSYRINKVVLKLMTNWGGGGPQSGSWTGGAGTAFDLDPQRVYTVIDHDDSTALGSTSEALQYETCRVTHPSKDITISFVPAVSATVYRTGVTSAYRQAYKVWMDLANTDVPHYGVKGYIPNSATAWQPSYKVLATYYISFKQVR